MKVFFLKTCYLILRVVNEQAKKKKEKVLTMAVATPTTSIDKHDNNLETYSLIWLDSTVNQAKEYVETQNKLRQLFNHLKIFDNVEQCTSFIQSVPKDDRIIFITNDQFGQEILPQIHLLRQIFVIYIYDPDHRQNNNWTRNFEKVSQKQTSEIIKKKD